MAGTNWAGNIRYESEVVKQPSSVSELQELIAAASKVKALGTRHSFNRIADCPGGLQVRTDGLDLEITTDADAMTATVPGGWSYSKVTGVLESRGLALANLGSLPHISVAGATATGTHGSGDTNQMLAAAIAALEVVTADGSVVTVDRSMPELSAMAIGLGAFGVITQITLDVQPSYLVRQDIYQGATWSTVLESFDEIMASAYSVNLHADYSSATTRNIWQKSLVEVDSNGDPIEVELPDRRWGGLRYPDTELEAGHTTTISTPGPWSQRLAHFTPESSPSAGGDELQTEYFVDRPQAVPAMEALRAMGDRIDPHLHGTEIRTVAGDGLWMSPATGRDCLCIGFTWKKHPKEVVALLPDIEASLAPFNPTAHWGKLFTLSRNDLAARFPRLDDFLELANQMDPLGKFHNPFMNLLAGRSRTGDPLPSAQ